MTLVVQPGLVHKVLRYFFDIVMHKAWTYERHRRMCVAKLVNVRGYIDRIGVCYLHALPFDIAQNTGAFIDRFERRHVTTA